jgi:hypothetical protein
MSELTNNSQTELLESINEKLDKIFYIITNTTNSSSLTNNNIKILDNTDKTNLCVPDDVYWSNYKKSIIVYGNTRPIKEYIKKAGGKWNNKVKGWYFRSPKFNSWNPGIKNVEKQFSGSDSE